MADRRRPPGAAAAVYRRQVRERALGKPKGVLDWAQSILIPVVVVLLFWYALGRDKALEQLTKTLLVMAGGGIVAALFVVIRLWRAVFEIHQEDLDRISAIERKQDAAVDAVETKWLNKRNVYVASIEGLTKQVEALQAAREPKFTIEFLPQNDEDSRPYLQTLTFGQPRPGASMKEMRDRRYRVGIVNLSSAAVPGVHLVLAKCTPGGNFIHINHRLLVMDSDPPLSERDLPPSIHGEPTLFFDVVNECSGANHTPKEFMFCYANPGIVGPVPPSTNSYSYEIVLRCVGGGVACERSFLVEKRWNEVAKASDHLTMRPL